MTSDDTLDNLFHGCAWYAFLEQAALEQGPPDPEATRRRAFRYYEQALAEKNRGQGPRSDDRPPQRAAGQGGEASEGGADRRSGAVARRPHVKL